MPHKPGHGTQRKRIERQARGRTAIPVSKSTTQASQQALKDAEDRRLDRLVTQNQDLKNLPSTTEQIIGDMPDKFKDRFTNPDGSTKTYNQMNEADKTIFNFYDDGRNQYQRMINNFIQSSPESARAYATRFPIANLIQKFTPALVGAAVGVPLGLGTLYDEGRRLGSATIGGLKDIAMSKGIIPRDDINPNTGTTSVKTDVISPAAASRAENQSLMPDIDFLSPQDMGFDAPLGRFVPNPQDMNITAQPGRFVPNPQDMNIQPKMTARDYFDDLSQAEKEFVLGLRQDNPAGMLQTDPNMFTNPATGNPLVFAPTQSEVNQLRGNIPGINRTTKMTRNMMEQLDPFINPDVPFVPLRDGGIASLNNFNMPSNQGGLASINNPQYNELMMASDFDI